MRRRVSPLSARADGWANLCGGSQNLALLIEHFIQASDYPVSPDTYFYYDEDGSESPTPSTHGYRFLYMQTYENTTTPVYTASEIPGYSQAVATPYYATSEDVSVEVMSASGYFLIDWIPVYVYTGGNSHAYSYGGDYRGYVNGRSTTMRLVTSTGDATPDTCAVTSEEARSYAVAFVSPSSSPSPSPSPLPQLSMMATVSPPGPHAVDSTVTLLVSVDHAMSLGMVAIAIAFSTSSVALVSSSTPVGSPYSGVTTAVALVPSHHDVEATITTASGTSSPASGTLVVNLQMRVLAAGNVTLRGTAHTPEGAVVVQNSVVACGGCVWATT